MKLNTLFMSAKNATQGFNTIQERLSSKYGTQTKEKLIFPMTKFGLYTLFPCLFDDFFAIPKKLNERLNTLLLTGAMYILGEDSVFDHNNGFKYFYVKDLQKFIYTEINDIFDSNENIWKTYHWIETLYQKYSYYEKITFSRNPLMYLYPSHLKLYIVKHLFTRLVYDFKSQLTTEKSLYPKIYIYNKLYRFFYIYQLFDDIRDFKADFNNGHLTHSIVKTLHQFGLLKEKVFKLFSTDDLFNLYVHSNLFTNDLKIIQYEIQNLYIEDGKNSWNLFVGLFESEINKIAKS